MPVQFLTPSVNIPPGSGRRTISGSVNFTSDVIRAGVALNGFALDFAESGDRHINVVEVDTDVTTILGTTVSFDVECQYADRNFDDPYQGSVSVLVVAEVQ